MATTLPSPPHKRARLARSLDAATLEAWPAVDESQLQDAEQRQRYEKLKNAVELYASGAVVANVTKAAGVKARWFYRLLDKCAAQAPDGRIWGYRCLVLRSCISEPIRQKPRDPEKSSPSAGWGGYFRKLLRDKPEIETKLVAALKRLGKDKLSPQTLNFRGVHRIFVRECRSAGLTDADYPLNTQFQARAPLKKWLDNDFLSKHAVAWFAAEVSPDASQSAAYGEGNGQDTRIDESYSAWQLDEMTVDVLTKFELLTETGDVDVMDVDRYIVIRLIALGSGVNLSWSLIVARQVTAYDVVFVLWDAIHGRTKPDAVIPGLDYHPNGGFPATAIPELQYRVPSVLYLDNALAHLAEAVQRVVALLFGAVVRIGRPGVPQERANVETDIKTMTHGLIHQLPQATGSHPTSALRKRSKGPIQGRLVGKELEQSIDVYLSNRNGLPVAASRYVAPLERLRRQVAAGQIKANTLPLDKRRPHLFYQPFKVTVRVDLDRGRRPFVNFLGVRYTNGTLQRSYGLVGKVFTARIDPRELRTLWLYDRENGHEWGCLNAVGRWGKFPHDLRIRKLFLLLKRQHELGEHAEDDPLEQLYGYLRSRASQDRRNSTRLAYLMRYLEGWSEEPAPGVKQACHEWRQAQQAANDAGTLPMMDEPENKGSTPASGSPEETAKAVAAPPAVLTFAPSPRRRMR